MPYAHLILHTDEYDLDTDIYDHRHMSVYVPICAYICMYPLLLAIHMCLYVWFLHVIYMRIQAYMHWFGSSYLPAFACIVRNICTFS
jgi:hypothetical protein